MRSLDVARIDANLVLAAGNDAFDSDEFGYVTIRDADQAEGEGHSPAWTGSSVVAVARVDGRLAAADPEPVVTLRSLPGGEIIDQHPAVGSVADVLTGGRRSDLVFSHSSPDGVQLLPGLPQRALRGEHAPSTFQRSVPSSWPVTADTYGVFKGRAVRATGTVSGGVSGISALDRLRTWSPDPSPTSRGRSPATSAMSKPGLPTVESVSLCTTTSGDTFLGTVCGGRAQVWNVNVKGTARHPRRRGPQAPSPSASSRVGSSSPAAAMGAGCDCGSSARTHQWRA